MIDHVRRAVVVVLTALALLVAPQIAHAAFTARTAPAIAVSTATLTEPGNVGTQNYCTGGWLSRGMVLDVNGHTGNDFENAQFVYTLYRGNGNSVADVETTSSRYLTLVAGNQLFGTNVFRLTIQPRLGNWTGPTVTRTFTC